MFRIEQVTGYDRSVALYSPDGRIIQVEYARRAVARGAISVGVLAEDGVILAGRRRVDVLIRPAPKIFVIDDHIALVFSGFSADGFALVSYARERAQLYRYIYNEPADVKFIVLELSEHMHTYTQIGGLRPYGCGLLIGGVDAAGPALYYVDPGGAISELIAGAMGRDKERAEALLREFVTQNGDKIKFDDALALALAGILVASEKVSPSEIEIGYIRVAKPVFKILDGTSPEIKPYFERAEKIAKEFHEKHKEEES